MEIILLEKVDNVGTLGDKVSVKSGFARNYLIPQGKAVFASAENVKQFEERRAELEQQAADKLAAAEARKAQIAALEEGVTIAHRAGDEGKLFGSVGPSDIADALTAMGQEVAKREVRLSDGPLRLLGEHTVELHLHSDVNVSVAVHVVADSEAQAG